MKTTNYWTTIATSAANTCLLFAAILALVPSSAKAQCAQGWDVGGRWQLMQSDGIRVCMDQLQEGTKVQGEAWYNDKNHHLCFGNFSGTIHGNNFNVRVVWDTKNVGHWDGTIQPNGIIQGRCSDEAVRSYKATFVSERPMVCMTAAGPTHPSATPGRRQ